MHLRSCQARAVQPRPLVAAILMGLALATGVQAHPLAPALLEIEAQGRTLVVRGKRDAAAAEEGALRRQERWSGDFSRSFSIPEHFDADGAEANYEYGVLTVRIPKRAELQPRRISVEAA